METIKFKDKKKFHNVTNVNTKDLSGIAIVIRMISQNIVRKQITALTGIRRKLLIGKAG